MTTKKASPQKSTGRNRAAEDAPRGNMTAKEIKPLAIAARQAFDFQRDLGNVDDAVSFDAWRRDQCMAAVQRPGLSACDHGQFRPLLAHFLTLAGRDDAAFNQLMRTGKTADHADPDDTHEERSQLAFLIVQTLQAHITLADSTIEILLESAERDWAATKGNRPYPGPSPKWLAETRAKKAAIVAAGGPIREGYLVYVARQKTRRPTLNLGPDLAAGLAQRLTVRQLTELRNTLVNRISAKEGVGHRHNRNKGQTTARRRAATTDQTLDQQPRVDFS